ncbi:MAG TPA: gliding motility protein GldC [Puia sp.]|nr:gliding motility protein GldC [Puia sp.]
MQQSSIHINVGLDANKVPQQINWSATDSTAETGREAKAMMLSFWDGADKSALRIDLWTKDMMVDEMADFFYQTFMTMAESYERATKNAELAADIQQFAAGFYRKFKELQVSQNKT